MDVILANIAVWGLLFALLNLFIVVEKYLRDPDKPQAMKFLVAIGAVVLVSYAFAIAVLVCSCCLAGRKRCLRNKGHFPVPTLPKP